VLRIRDVYPGSTNFFHPEFASKNLSILTQKNYFQALGNIIRVVHHESGFITHPVSRGSKKAPDPGSGTLERRQEKVVVLYQCIFSGIYNIFLVV
jgi:hypothetical protein